MVAVQDLLREPALALVGVHVPEPDAELRWVATSELADPAPFLEGGEILLTTGLDTARWHRRWHAYVQRLVSARVAAVGIGTGLTHDRPPEDLVGACRELGMNLFEVPRETAFVAVSRTAARLLEQGAEAAARRALADQRQLTQAALRPDDTAALLTRLALIVDGAAATLDGDGRPEVGPLGPRRADLDLALAAAEIDRIRPGRLRAASSVAAGGATTTIQPLGLRGRPTGYLAVHAPGRATDQARSAVTTTVALLSLAAQRRDDRRTVDRDLRARTLELLVHADVRTARVVLAAAAGTGSGAVDLPARIRMLRATGPSDQLDDAVRRLEGGTRLVARVHDEVWVLVAPARTRPTVDALADAGLRVGVGDAADLDDAARSHHGAGHALAAATTAAPVVRWDELVGRGAVSLLDPAPAASFATAFLGSLGAAPELVPTLRSFLRHHGSRLKVAEDLGVHRNTVRNRVEQIEAALGRSLEDPQTRVDAWIALQVAALHD